MNDEERRMTRSPGMDVVRYFLGLSVLFVLLLLFFIQVQCNGMEWK